MAYTAYFINKNNIANQSFIVNKQDISFSNLPSNFNDYKILEIADLHSMKFGENNEKLISEIDKLSPDIIFVTGDMFSSSQLKKDDGTYNRDYNEESLPGFQLLKNLSQKAIVTQTIEPYETGVAKLNGEEWTAMSKDETRIEAGKLVEVVAIEGVKLIVKEVSEELLEGEPIKENKDSISKEIDIKIKTSK